MAQVLRQRTLRKAVALQGVGLHSGAPCQLRLEPAAPNNGVRFVLGGGDGNATTVNAAFDLVEPSPLCTALRATQGSVRTVEHLMAALWTAGVTNCDVQVAAGAEVPILDGSSAPFAGALVGNVVEQDARLPVLRVTKRVAVEDGAKQSWAQLLPLDGAARLEVLTSVDDYGGRLPATDPVQHTLHYASAASRSAIARAILPARTFGFRDEVEAVRAQGLARGGSLDNCVVFHGDGSPAVLNPGGLRFADEWARHKFLDCLGDLALCARPVAALHARFESSRPGHATTNLALRALFADPSAFELQA